jgi:RHS repeat-associated protein
VLRDVNSDGSTVEYVNGGELDDHLWQRKSDGTTQYFLTDHQGSTRALADASGAVTANYNYDTFGNGFSGTATRFGYTGREHDAETGLLYYRARWYDPGQGRFVNEDPIGLSGGINWYGYVGNDPVNWIDPVGLFDKGNFKPKLSTKVKIGRGLGLLGALALAWEIWNSGHQGGPTPLPLPQATPTPSPTPAPQTAASGAGAGNGNTCQPPNIPDILDALSKAKRNVDFFETTLGSGHKVIFRRDFGAKAHPIGSKYPQPVDHYNIEVHKPDRCPGRFKRMLDLHIVVDANGNVVDVIVT